ncbi:hypothetical protein NDU88_003621 [Pleurodeles waltl]|uniref:Uncharacterized protein n=1 Tax=Pleurodeles waltl TaxID=8319 RepID=A0AAV7W2P6_PLEWA|nr:hypothetical protein NDU88_003621 [Pleurodeles waltl]
MFILSFFLGGGSPAPGRPDPGAEGHPPHPGRHGATDRRAAAPHSRVSSEAAPTVRLTSLAPVSMRSYRQGGVHQFGRVASSLAGGSRFERLARPQQLYLRSGPRPGARPRRSESDRGAPVPGLTLCRSPLLSEPGATESKSTRANKGRRPRRSTIRRGPQVTVRSKHLSAAHGSHSGGGPVSGRAPVPGLVETPSARPPSWETHRSGRDQRSRLGPR